MAVFICTLILLISRMHTCIPVVWEGGGCGVCWGGVVMWVCKQGIDVWVRTCLNSCIFNLCLNCIF